MTAGIPRMLRRALTLPPHVTAAKAARMAKGKLEARRLRRGAERRPTFCVEEVGGSLGRLFAGFDDGRARVAADGPDATALVGEPRRPASVANAPVIPLVTALPALCARYVEHRFDLLGSGWVHVRHGMECHGLEGHVYPPGPAPTFGGGGSWLAGRINAANLEGAKARWRLVDPGYTPVDWHLDFKSGYRWAEATWYRDIAYGQLPGVDVKIPWELARMQHLPQMALAAWLPARHPELPAWRPELPAASHDTTRPAEGVVPGAAAPPPETLAREFRNQVLDFAATNPPGFGVNWACTMDVGIRVANWLVTHDLFRDAGHRFDEPFQRVLLKSVLEHGRHIAANLEWADDWRGNHYLADVVGLLFASVSLPPTPESDAWLALAAREVTREVLAQLNPDGTCFEGSTAYHRLSTEMALYATALLLGLPEERRSLLPRGLDPEDDCSLMEILARRLAAAGRFAADVTTPAGRIVQIGDNDSGRFLKLGGSFGFEEGVPVEDHLDHRHLADALAGLFTSRTPRAAGRSAQADAAPTPPAADVEAALSAFAGPHRTERSLVAALSGQHHLPAPPGAEGRTRAHENHRLDPPTDARVFDLPAPGTDLREGLVATAYPDFGLYVYRGPRLFLTIRCGPVGQRGNGGHDHNDQLSLELWLDGIPRIVDPGTYVYTPLPKRRDEYRSIRAHFAPRIGDREPARLDHGLFQLTAASPGRCLAFHARLFHGAHSGYATPVHRRVDIHADVVRVTDWAEDGTPPADPQPADLPYSPGYGILLRPVNSAV